MFPADGMESSAQGYSLQNNMLARRWVLHGENFVGDPTMQIVVPSKFCQTMLQISHANVAGHLGFRKITVFCVTFSVQGLNMTYLLTLKHVTHAS